MRTKFSTRLNMNIFVRFTTIVVLCLSFVATSEMPLQVRFLPCKTPSALAFQDSPDHDFLPPYLIARADLYAKLHNQQTPSAVSSSVPDSNPTAAYQEPERKEAASTPYVLIYDARGDNYLPGFRARFEHGDQSADTSVNKAFEFQVAMRSFLKKVFNRNSIDDKGADLVGTVHYGWHVNNAYWNKHQMLYGDGDGEFFNSFISIDIVGHEMFHAVTDSACNLVYEGQSGALDEHLSDVFGVLLRQWHENLTTDKDSWLLGSELFTGKVNGRALRDMRYPGTAYNDPFMGKDEQAAHMKDYVYTDDDNGGVHYNSGIPNKAFALFATAIGGKAWKTAGHVWFEVATAGHLAQNCDFQTFANETMAACAKQAPQDAPKLKAAWAAVGIKVA
jgi:Zn-dependent metalloprotease